LSSSGLGWNGLVRGFRVTQRKTNQGDFQKQLDKVILKDKDYLFSKSRCLNRSKKIQIEKQKMFLSTKTMKETSSKTKVKWGGAGRKPFIIILPDFLVKAFAFLRELD
jgi:hypothetical protein